MGMMVGDNMVMDCAQVVPGRIRRPCAIVVPEICVIWGNNPIVTNADGFLGHWIVDLMKRGTKLIDIDPRLSWMGAQSEYYLQLRPGTDAALALGWMNVIIQEDLYDHEFVDSWCYGFEQLAERAAEYPGGARCRDHGRGRGTHCRFGSPFRHGQARRRAVGAEARPASRKVSAPFTGVVCPERHHRQHRRSGRQHHREHGLYPGVCPKGHDDRPAERRHLRLGKEKYPTPSRRTSM